MLMILCENSATNLQRSTNSDSLGQPKATNIYNQESKLHNIIGNIFV